MIYFTYTNIAILLILALIHIYWAMGGKKGLVLPTNSEGKPSINPGMFVTLLVAVALICFAYFHYVCIHSLGTIRTIARYLVLVGSVVFFLRFIGDFKYAGIFKKERSSKFARNDTWLYSPLCLLIATFAFITFITN